MARSISTTAIPSPTSTASSSARRSPARPRRDSITVQFGERTGTFAPWWKSVEVVLYGWPSARAKATVAGSTAPLKAKYDSATHALHVVVPDMAGKGELRISE